MDTQSTSQYFTAFTNLQTELMNAYSDVVKKADPEDFTGNISKLQSRLIVATLENLTETVKQFRKTLG